MNHTTLLNVGIGSSIHLLSTHILCLMRQPPPACIPKHPFVDKQSQIAERPGRR